MEDPLNEGASKEFTPAIGGDKAFPCIELPDYPGLPGLFHLFTTQTGESERDKNDPFRHSDPGIAAHRSVVERSIGIIKKWLILSHTDFISKQSQSDLTLLLRFLAALSNYQVFVDRQQKYL